MVDYLYFEEDLYINDIGPQKYIGEISTEVAYNKVLAERTIYNKIYLLMWFESINCNSSWFEPLIE